MLIICMQIAYSLRGESFLKYKSAIYILPTLANMPSSRNKRYRGPDGRFMKKAVKYESEQPEGQQILRQNPSEELGGDKPKTLVEDMLDQLLLHFDHIEKNLRAFQPEETVDILAASNAADGLPVGGCSCVAKVC